MDRRRSAITETLRQRIVAALHLGTLASGDRLPSLRRVGLALHSDPRVVLAAYRQLAREGLVRVRPRSGVFVAASGRGEDPLPEVAAWVVEALLQAVARGMPPAELRRQALLYLEATPVRVACVECNDDQIYALCRQVEVDYGFAATAFDLDREPIEGRREPGASDADLVLTTRFHAAEAQRLGRRLRRPVIVATLDPLFVSEIRRLLGMGRVWWVCTDPRFTEKLPRMFPEASVTPVVLGRDSLDGIPADAPVYVTRKAAERLPPGWHAGRVVTVPRAFSAETARALVTFLVRRNVDAARAASRPAAKRSRSPAPHRRPRRPTAR